MRSTRSGNRIGPLGGLRRIRRRLGEAQAEELEAPIPPWQFAAAPGSLLFVDVSVTCEGDVLMVGDSHLLLCGAHQAFPGCDVTARRGRESTEGIAELERMLRRQHDVVVFDLSTNDVLDPPNLEANLERLRDLTDGRQLVIVNTWRSDFRNLHKRVNGILRTFADQHTDRVALVDWATYIDETPAALAPDTDYVHFTTEAYLERIVLLSEAIDAARARVG